MSVFRSRNVNRLVRDTAKILKPSKLQLMMKYKEKQRELCEQLGRDFHFVNNRCFEQMDTKSYTNAILQRTAEKQNYVDVICLLRAEIKIRNQFEKLYGSDDAHAYWVQNMLALVSMLEQTYNKKVLCSQKKRLVRKENVSARTSYVPPHMRRRQQMLQ